MRVVQYQTRNVSPDYVATTRQGLSVRDMSAIERRPTHLYESLGRHYFGTRKIVTLLSPVYFCCLGVVATRDELSPLLATRYGFGVLDMYARPRSKVTAGKRYLKASHYY